MREYSQLYNGSNAFSSRYGFIFLIWSFLFWSQDALENVTLKQPRKSPLLIQQDTNTSCELAIILIWSFSTDTLQERPKTIKKATPCYDIRQTEAVKTAVKTKEAPHLVMTWINQTSGVFGVKHAMSSQGVSDRPMPQITEKSDRVDWLYWLLIADRLISLLILLLRPIREKADFAISLGIYWDEKSCVICV